jgi:hypothetical protein
LQASATRETWDPASSSSYCLPVLDVQQNGSAA